MSSCTVNTAYKNTRVLPIQSIELTAHVCYHISARHLTQIWYEARAIEVRAYQYVTGTNVRHEACKMSFDEIVDIAAAAGQVYLQCF